MCGIVGRFSKESNSAKVSDALFILRHRGPDDSGSLNIDINDWNICLGQTRLSIIDLSPGGHQPFSSSDKNFSLIFNGEIYNYKEIRSYLIGAGFQFKTQSDTEVLLNAWIHWGVECLPKLKGMFSFAIYNKLEKKITLVRDAFGIKPLFYQKNHNDFGFASEIRALENLFPKRFNLDDQQMFEYLSFGNYDLGEKTFFEGVKSLEPGHILTIDFSNSNLSTKKSRWWWPEIQENRSFSETQAIDEIRERFLENVKKHLISDVPIGAALSGGLDSSSIVCAMRHVEPNLEINTFSYIAQGSNKSEEPWVNLVNQHVGAVSHKVVITPQELVKDLDDMIKFQGEPFGSTSIYAQYRVYKLAKESGIKVTLDGQGADELFAGYQGYPEWKIRSLLSHGKVFQVQKFLYEWSKGPGRSFRMWLENSIAVNLPKFLVPLAYSMRGRRQKNKLYDQNVLSDLNIKTDYSINYQSQIGWDRALVARLRHALTNGELSQLLRHGDRNSMRWSIESRVPFLTNDFAEYVLTLPEEFLLSKGGTTKFIFRKAMKGIVPDEILERKDKIGFETPELEWFRSINHNINEWLEDLSFIPWINMDQAKIYFDNVLTGNTPFSWQTWRLINAARWVRLVLNR